MKKEDIVLILAPGAFKRSSSFWFGPVALFRALGYENIFQISYDLRDVSFLRKAPRNLGCIDLHSDILDCKSQVECARRRFGSDKKYIFIGHSKSGLVGQLLAEKNLFDGLISLNPAVPKGFSAVTISSFWWLREILFQIIKNLSAKIPVRRSRINFIAGHLPRSLKKGDIERSIPGLVWESGLVIWDLAFRKPKVNPLLIKCPILFFASKEDLIVKLSAIQRVFEWHRKSREGKNKERVQFYLLGGAHDPFVGEQVHEVIEVIDGWIKENF